MVDPAELLSGIVGFQWDEGNIEKSWKKHRVRFSESEEVFIERPLLIARDEEHSRREPRYAAWGQSASGRRLTIVFTIRGSLIRVVSARDMSRGERRDYEHAAEAEADPGVQD